MGGGALKDRLQEEHLEVLDAFHDIEIALQQRRFSRLGGLIERFWTAYHEHTLREHRVLLSLDRRYRGETEIFERLCDHRRLRDQTLRDVQEFVDQFAGRTVTRGVALEFSLLLESIGAMVVRQFECEEQRIFTLYQQEDARAGVPSV